MTPPSHDDDFLGRWSKRKHAARRGEPVQEEPPAPPAAPAPVASQAPTASDPRPAEPAPLPPVASLTPDSDFTPFMAKEVDPGARRQALRTLFRDPRFNVMDGLDVYIDDYSKPDPIPADWLARMNQMARLGDYRPPEAENEPAAAPLAQAEEASIPQEDQRVAQAEDASIPQEDQGISEPVAPSPPDTSAVGSPLPDSRQS